MFKGSIRELKKEDVPAVEAIYDLYWHDSFRDNLTKRLNGFVSGDSDVMDQRFQYFVAEEDGEVVGVVGFRKSPDHMKGFAKTGNPAEFYIMAVRNRGQGLGRLLLARAVETARQAGYTEAILYSGETHQEVWGMYDHLGYERVGPAVAPNGEPGMIWRAILNK